MREMDQAMTEAELQQVVEDALHTFGWVFHHETDSRKSRKGFPDLMGVHPDGWWLLIELKRESGKLSADQVNWLEAADEEAAMRLIVDRHLQRITGVVRPSTVDELVDYLRRYSGRS